MLGLAPVQQETRPHAFGLRIFNRALTLAWGKAQRLRERLRFRLRTKPRAVVIGSTVAAKRMAAYLTECGLESRVSATPAEVIADSALQPDIIIADLLVTGSRGMESVRQLRRSLPNSTVCFYSSALLGNMGGDFHLCLGRTVLRLAARDVDRDSVYLLLRR